MGLFDRIKGVFGPDWGETTHYQCPDCGEAFVYASSIDDPTCPYCDSRELVVTETA